MWQQAVDRVDSGEMSENMEMAIASHLLKLKFRVYKPS